MYAGHFEPLGTNTHAGPVTLNVMADDENSARLMLYSFGLEMAPGHRLVFVWEDDLDDYEAESLD